MHAPAAFFNFSVLLVILAAVLDILANLLLARSQGFHRRWIGFTALALVGLAFYCLSLAVKNMDLAVAYAMWGGFGILGTSVLWFEEDDQGNPVPAEQWRALTMASVNTHDLPPTAGYLQFEHVKLRAQLHLLSGPVEEFQASATAERDAMMDRLVESGLITPEVAGDVEGHIQEIVEAMHKMLLKSPSVLLQAALVDGVGETRTQNQPGTSSEYSNWRVPLAGPDLKVVHTDEVFDLPRVQSLAAIMNGEK